MTGQGPGLLSGKIADSRRTRSEHDHRQRTAQICSGARACRRARLCRRLASARRCAACGCSRLIAFLPGFFQIPPVDRDEARFAQATKQMLESARIRRYPLSGRGALQEAGRNLLAAGGSGESRRSARRAAGAHDDLALPVALPVRRNIGAVLLTYWAALAFVPRRAALARRHDDGELRAAWR